MVSQRLWNWPCTLQKMETDIGQYQNESNKIFEISILFGIIRLLCIQHVKTNVKHFDKKDVIATSISKAHFVKAEYASVEMFCMNVGFIFSSLKDSCQLMTENLQVDGSVHLKKILRYYGNLYAESILNRLHPANKQRWMQCFIYVLDEFAVFLYTSLVYDKTELFGAQRLPTKELNIQTAFLRWGEKNKTPCSVMEVEIFDLHLEMSN